MAPGFGDDDLECSLAFTVIVVNVSISFSSFSSLLGSTCLCYLSSVLEA